MHHHRLVTFLLIFRFEWLPAVRAVGPFFFGNFAVYPAPDAFTMEQMVAGLTSRKKLIFVLIREKLFEADRAHLVSGTLIDLIEC